MSLSELLRKLGLSWFSILISASSGTLSTSTPHISFRLCLAQEEQWCYSITGIAQSLKHSTFWLSSTLQLEVIGLPYCLLLRPCSFLLIILMFFQNSRLGFFMSSFLMDMLQLAALALDLVTLVFLTFSCGTLTWLFMTCYPYVYIITYSKFPIILIEFLIWAHNEFNITLNKIEGLPWWLRG